MPLHQQLLLEQLMLQHQQLIHELYNVELVYLDINYIYILKKYIIVIIPVTKKENFLPNGDNRLSCVPKNLNPNLRFPQL